MLTVILVLACWSVLVALAVAIASDWQRHFDEQARAYQQTMADQDDFTPSMQRWGYIDEKRGQ